MAEKQIKEYKKKAIEGDLSFLSILEIAQRNLFQTTSSLLFINSKERIKQIVEANKLRPSIDPTEEKIISEKKSEKMFLLAIIQIHNLLDALFFFKWKTKNTFEKQDVINIAKIVSELHQVLSSKQISSHAEQIIKSETSPHKRSLSYESKEIQDIRHLILQINKVVDQKLSFIQQTDLNPLSHSSIEILSNLITDCVNSFQKFYLENSLEHPSEKIDRVLNFDIDINNDLSVLTFDLEQIKKMATHLHQLVITNELKEDLALQFLKTISSTLCEHKNQPQTPESIHESLHSSPTLPSKSSFRVPVITHYNDSSLTDTSFSDSSLLVTDSPLIDLSNDPSDNPLHNPFQKIESDQISSSNEKIDVQFSDSEDPFQKIDD